MIVYPDFLLGDWLDILNADYQAEAIGDFGSGVIEPVVIPTVLHSAFVRVSVTNASGKDSWERGLKIYQTIDTFFGGFDVISEHVISLDKPEIIQMIVYPNGYRLRLEFFRWFKDCQVSIKEFIG